MHSSALNDPAATLSRKAFGQRLDAALDRAQTSEHHVALIHVDLDRFRVINLTLGRDAGDDLLRTARERMVAAVGGDGIIGRLGGDEFVVLVDGLPSRDAVTPLVERVRSGLGGAFVVADQEIYVTSSVGVAVFPDDAKSSLELFASADKAVQRAKHVGRDNAQFFTTDMRGKDQARLALDRDLRRALERNEFLLHYQPQIDVNSGDVIGVEALIRWVRPGLGMVSPMDFIPLLEETGLIVPVGAWVLKTACAQAQAWKRDGIEPLRVAVNISASQLRQNHLLSTLERVLADTDIGPASVELELTEGLLIENTQASSMVLDRVRQMGIAISLDDFGTGYSSLSYLKRLPIDTLKIDRAFVRDVLSCTADQAIAAAIVDLAHALGLHVVAEGIETDDQLAFMRRLGCDGAQGYLIGRPMPADACANWIKDTRKKLARDSGTREVLVSDITAALRAVV
jgi:diguanylate cyclase (GGDEF)-like protein